MSLYTDASLILTPNGRKEGKIYSIKPGDGSGDMTAVRATTATLVNSEGVIENVAINVPRLDYTNGSCPSILVEPQRTNLFLRSEEFDNVAWIKGFSTVNSNVIVGPDGTMTADLLTDTSDSSSHNVSQSVNISSSSIITSSVFLKKNTSRYVGFRLFVPTNGIGVGRFSIVIDLDNGNVTSTLTSGQNIANLSYSVVDFGNGWYRAIISGTSPIGNASSMIWLSTSATPTNDGFASQSYVGNGQNVNLWGAQLEVGANATSYIPTVASAVTRNADVISKTGISDLIGQTEGTLFVDVEFDYVSNTFSNFISINNNINTQAISLNRESNNIIQFFIFNSGVQANLLTTNNSNGKFKIIGTYKANEFKLFVNGVLIGTDTSGTLPTLTTFNLGNIVGSSIQKNNINSAAIWKTALTDQECINLTTL